jgi:16S rRNA (guanine527-N7)-methyltransferase
MGLDDLDVSRETINRLRAYQALVLKWTKKINLVGKADIAEFWHRHILDCLQLIPLMPANVKTAIDLGSGAGLPGIILAIAANLDVTLIEADQRKAAFLRTVILELDLRATIVPRRIEATHLSPASLITARALAPLPKLLELSSGKLAPDGQCLFMKGENAEIELTDARNQWQMKVERFASRTSPTATILRLSEVRRAPSPTSAAS